MKTPPPVSFKELSARIERMKRKATLLGIGPVSENVVRAAFQVAVEEGFPPIFIASRNQVDLKGFGSGYLMGGMDQCGFAGLLSKVAGEERYLGPVFICRDHGGPWQRNSELDSKLPVKEAMDLAKRSFKGDLEAGFNYLHIDPTKCPLPHSRKDIVEWTAELLEFCEAARIGMGLPPVDYEIGTEDIKGGDTSDGDFESFVAEVSKLTAARSLPLPACVVGQTGTLTKLDRNEGGFHASTARRLASIARRYGMGFKEHNADYLDEMSLALHPDIGISGANVAPEFGLAETSALLELAECEEEAILNGWEPAAEPSGFKAKVMERVRLGAPWRKWLPSGMKSASEESLFGDAVAARAIVLSCGHYTFHDAAIIESIGRLYKNIEGLWGTGKASGHVLSRVRESIRRYVKPFNMTGVNGLAAHLQTKHELKKGA